LDAPSPRITHTYNIPYQPRLLSSSDCLLACLLTLAPSLLPITLESVSQSVGLNATRDTFFPMSLFRYLSFFTRFSIPDRLHQHRFVDQSVWPGMAWPGLRCLRCLAVPGRFSPREALHKVGIGAPNFNFNFKVKLIWFGLPGTDRQTDSIPPTFSRPTQPGPVITTIGDR
jgi:hypothetical protein